MSHLAPLISDLALILISAGIMTLLFKKLKQPLVLGYIVAGFVCSPHFTFTPSVVDADNIQTWSAATFRRYNPAFQNTRPSASRCPQRARNDPFPVPELCPP